MNVSEWLNADLYGKAPRVIERLENVILGPD